MAKTIRVRFSKIIYFTTENVFNVFKNFSKVFFIPDSKKSLSTVALVAIPVPDDEFQILLRVI